jgi:hypothetical protein
MSADERFFAAITDPAFSSLSIKPSCDKDKDLYRLREKSLGGQVKTFFPLFRSPFFGGVPPKDSQKIFCKAFLEKIYGGSQTPARENFRIYFCLSLTGVYRYFNPRNLERRNYFFRCRLFSNRIIVSKII